MVEDKLRRRVCTMRSVCLFKRVVVACIYNVGMGLEEVSRFYLHMKVENFAKNH